MFGNIPHKSDRLYTANSKKRTRGNADQFLTCRKTPRQRTRRPHTRTEPSEFGVWKMLPTCGYAGASHRRREYSVTTHRWPRPRRFGRNGVEPAGGRTGRPGSAESNVAHGGRSTPT
uniref:Uncharacterized protein n=1 Tax=Nocardia terpenica TaxID=455432 RepID=A0A0U1YZ76_9NOCA|nr:hypothetical protein [Nocardia terpenica]